MAEAIQATVRFIMRETENYFVMGRKFPPKPLFKKFIAMKKINSSLGGKKGARINPRPDFQEL